ncbi:MAG: ornithine--oxo-acid transaminase [Gemmatimonadota bacterium]|nr:ornithine--oxo-acid transaminase [Gemmatimonadota bacterium]
MTTTHRLGASPHSDATEGLSSAELIAIGIEWGVRNYQPLDTVLVRGEGCWVFDADGNKYLDCLSAYSALNLGHCHPRLLRAMTEQASRLTLTSRAFRNDQLPLFSRELAELCGKDAVLPMNTGAEAVETAIKAARRWGYERKKIPADRAEIIVFKNNFHGRTTTITGFSSEESYKKGFGPFTPGFVTVPFGDSAALQAAVSPRTCAVLTEPIQCEAGVIIPPDGYLRRVREICSENNVLLIADEIQTGLGRTGRLFACDHEDVVPDIYVLGKALAGGFYPVSAVVADRDVLDVFGPGSHGSTFGGNPLGCAIAREAVRVMLDEDLAARAETNGEWILEEIRALGSSKVAEVRGRGLIIGIELRGPARQACEELARKGMLCKETHDRVIRIAPPLIATRGELEFAVEKLAAVLA